MPQPTKERNRTVAKFGTLSLDQKDMEAITDGKTRDEEGVFSSSLREPTCEECRMKTPIYQCPRCLIRTCSLECCTCHKKRTGCSGKRNRTEFVPLSRMTDNTMRNDYFFLEEVLQYIPSNGKRARTEEASSTQTKSKKSRRLLQQAERRGITLQIMPPMMVRHKSNTSWYCGPRDIITWKVEVVMYPHKEVFCFNLSENEENIMDHILKHGEKGKVKVSSAGDHSLYILRLPSEARNPRYVEVAPSDSLKSVLRGMTIVEHPTIHCVPQNLRHQFATGSDKIVEQPNHCMTSSDGRQDSMDVVA